MWVSVCVCVCDTSSLSWGVWGVDSVRLAASEVKTTMFGTSVCILNKNNDNKNKNKNDNNNNNSHVFCWRSEPCSASARM